VHYLAHAAHILVRLLEFLLGAFCIVTATLLYPKEDGTIQSKLEDLWIRTDDFGEVALSRHARFMSRVAKLETHLLDRLFGTRLVSVQALGVSFCLSICTNSFALYWLLKDGLYMVAQGMRFYEFLMLACPALAIGVACVFVRNRNILRFGIILAALTCYAAEMLVGGGLDFDETTGLFGLFVIVFLIGGFLCDVVFITVTRRLLGWAGGMNSGIKVFALVFLNIVMSLLLLGPAFVTYYYMFTDARSKFFDKVPGWILSSALCISLSNIFDVLLALLFVLLALMLLIQFAIWPLLTRTLFRITDMKVRRGILVAIALGLIAGSLHVEKLSELFGKIIDKLSS
jgi:hypothetical protein